LPGSASSQVKFRVTLPQFLLGRLLLLAALLGPDILVLAIVPHAASLLGALAPLGIVSYAVLIGLGWSYFKRQQEPLRFSVNYYAAHLGCVGIVSLTNLAALHGFAFLLSSHTAHLLLRLTLLVGVALLALACVPARAWLKTVRETGLLWLYAALSGMLAWCLRFPFQSFWDASTSAPGRMLQVLAFHCVRAVLGVFLPDIHVNAATFTIGTPRFAIIVAEACSGMEGLGLVLVFTTVWLWYFRKESRFPQALLLVPVALISVWILNIARIALLVLIGNAGYGEIAMVGFHSQAGWIAFTTVAFGFSMATRKLRWVRRDAAVAIAAETRSVADETSESPATAAYLVPFLAILGAGFISKAGSGYFEWLYPLRFVAALIALWFSWPELKKLDWKFGWLAPVTGAGIFGLWLVPSLLGHAGGAGQSGQSQLGQALAALSPDARWIWIAFRVAAASITVPIAEELAFRGYLARRIVDRKFEAIPFSAVTLLSVALSSLAFGLMHGKQWLVGIVAGLAFAAVMKWRGRLSDAIVAHGTCNLLLAIWVLSRGDWAQW
jgi:exosortase E/protease (VPEID-CTERM system)